MWHWICGRSIFVGQERKRSRLRIAVLRLEPIPVDRSAIEPRRRARLQSRPLQPQGPVADHQGALLGPRRFAHSCTSSLQHGRVHSEMCPSLQLQRSCEVSDHLAGRPRDTPTLINRQAQPLRPAECGDWARSRATRAFARGTASCRIARAATRPPDRDWCSAAGTECRPRRSVRP